MVASFDIGETWEEERRHGFLFLLPTGHLHGERSLTEQAAIGLNRLAQVPSTIRFHSIFIDPQRLFSS